MSRLAAISGEDETIPRHAATRHSPVTTQNNEGVMWTAGTEILGIGADALLKKERNYKHLRTIYPI